MGDACEDVRGEEPPFETTSIVTVPRGGKVLTQSLAVCSRASPRLRPHVIKLTTRGQQPLSISQHAEVAALNQLPASIQSRHLRRCVVVVVRLKFNEMLGRAEMLCAKPCQECAGLISRLGLRAAVYSDGNALRWQTPQELLRTAQPSTGTKILLANGAPTGRSATFRKSVNL